MKTKLWILILVAALAVGGYHTAAAAPRPAIITFDSSLNLISLADAENEAATTTLTWHTAGMTDEYRLRLHTYILDRWEPVFPQESVPLEVNGSRDVTVRHPLNFGPPSFLLSILHVPSNSVVDQRIVTIPYDVSEASAEPVIDVFQADSGSIGAEQVFVIWSVSNRVPTSNLVFDQILADGSAVSVELPRDNLWVPSTAQGPVKPVYEQGATAITLRLRVVDIVSESVLAEQTIDVASAAVTAAGPITTDTGAAPIPTATPLPQPPPPGNVIVAFTADPQTVNPGSAITLSWEVQGTGGVNIDQSVPNVSAISTVVNAQSPKGSAQVYLPDYAAYSAIYTLRTADGLGTAQVEVKVHCPFTFFFGDADGCPTDEPISVGASYQPFENGYMLWRSDTNEIYVHYNDGTAAYFVEKDYADLPDAQTEEVPPVDRVAPSSGFGKVWAHAPGVRERLGWALENETGYTAQVQGVALTRDPRPAYAFYITLPDGSTVGSGFGRWEKLP